MLFYSPDPPSSGYALNLPNADFWPPEAHQITADEYLGWLRAAYKQSPAPFLNLAREARGKQLTLCSATRPDLLPVLYQALVAIAGRKGWIIGGGDTGNPPDAGPAHRELYANASDMPAP